MAFMVPHVKNNYDLYGGKRNRTISNSSRKSNDSASKERLAALVLAAQRGGPGMPRQMSYPGTVKPRTPSKQVTIPENSRRRTVSERPRTASEKSNLSELCVSPVTTPSRVHSSSECSTYSDNSDTNQGTSPREKRGFSLLISKVKSVLQHTNDKNPR